MLSAWPAMRGDYNRYSRSQLQIYDLTKPYIKLGLEKHNATLPSPGSPLIIADYGVSTGANSSQALSYIIDGLRDKYSFAKTPCILVVQEDIPRNNWETLFCYTYGDEQSFLKKHRGVFALASALTFYEQILPDSWLHFCFCSMALQWVSKCPAKLANHCFTLFASPEESALFQQQADEDWVKFITARSKALVKGGILVANIWTQLTEHEETFDSLYKAALILLKRDLITKEELLDFNVPVVWRSLADIKKHSSLYETIGLELVTAEKAPVTKSVYYEAYLDHRDTGVFADEISTALMATVEPLFLDCLSANRTRVEKKSIAEALLQEYKRIVAASPRKFAHCWGTMAVVFRKI